MTTLAGVTSAFLKDLLLAMDAPLPLFVLGFVGLVALNSFGLVPAALAELDRLADRSSRLARRSWAPPRSAGG